MTLYFDPKTEVVMDYDRIAPKLSLGGATKTCGPFDAVVLAAYELQKRPQGRCVVIHAPLDDAVPSKKEIRTALLAARQVQNLRKKGRNVLVTCAQGVNRSALITALALMMDGASAREAVKRIRKKRKGTLIKPLSNEAFVRVLKKYEEVRHGS